MTNVITLKNPIRPVRNFVYAIIFWLFATTLMAPYIVAVTKMASGYAAQKWSDLISSVTRVQIVREYIPAHQASISELIIQVSKEYHLPPIVLRALVLQESGGSDQNLYRFEPEQFSRRAKIDKGLSESDRRMFASSHGLTQVMGYRAKPDCGVHWSKLYDNSIALRCAAKIFKQNLAGLSGKDPAVRLREAYRIYNGSGPEAEAHADQFMAKIGSILFKEIGVML